MKGHGPRHLNMARQPKLINSGISKSARGIINPGRRAL